MNNNKDISEIFKAEYSNLVAVLCHFYKINDIQLAEDIVSDTFIKAMKTWAIKGVPQSPKAWLRKTAKNLFIDHIRRHKKFDEDISPKLISALDNSKQYEITEKIIEDSQLEMIFAICNPSMNQSGQICLALRILCGFSIDEIAQALLTNKETINKRLYRAKKSIKLPKYLTTNLTEKEYTTRLASVLRVIYLIFNEGYYSSVNKRSMRQEICWEAMYLCKFLEEKSNISNSQISALLALMCFHASRFDARLSVNNEIQLYADQDRTKWNKDLINKGIEYLNKSSSGKKISKYHIEAAIAYWHTTEQSEKWNNILQLYNKLLTIEYSPIIAMNRTYALAKANSVGEAIDSALKLELNENQYYYCLLSDLYRMNKDNNKARFYLKEALSCTKKVDEKILIQEKLKKIKSELT